MRPTSILLSALLLLPTFAYAQGTVPTFQYKVGSNAYTLVGRDPAQGGTTTIPTVLVPVALAFQSKRLDATKDMPALLRSPVFSKFEFPAGDDTQYADAMLRATSPKAQSWHTLFPKPDVMNTVTIAIPPSAGYALTSRQTGKSMAVADIEFVQRELFKQVPKQEGKLVVAITRNTTYYTEEDATLCCSWGTHGTDSVTGNSFVLASYLDSAPKIVEEQDVQPITEQLAEFINDPLHDPLLREEHNQMPGNRFPPWMRPVTMRPGDQGRCGGTHVASAYFLLEPTDTNRKNNIPASKPFIAHGYHLQNVALLSWYVGKSADLGTANSFPDSHALSEPAKPCPARRRETARPQPTVAAAPLTGAPNGHELIGYWTGSTRLSEVSPQWDVIIVAFATPDNKAAEGTLRFQTPEGLDPEQFKSDIAHLKSQGKKVMISLGGGGQYFSLADPKSIATFVSCVTQIVSEYGFDGIDIDFESPSLSLDAGDTDFKKPTTPSVVNLIAGMRQLREHFGPSFMISLVPEGTQIPAGHLTCGGQFGSYLPIAYGIRDILSFMDVQDYNTPPIEGLDGEIYQAGSVDYHAAATELVLHGFNVGGNRNQFFPPLPADQVAVGFLTGETTPVIVSQAMDYIITGRVPSEAAYKLRKPGGYSGMIGAMFWTIDADRGENYRFSNVAGPELHGFSKAK